MVPTMVPQRQLTKRQGPISATDMTSAEYLIARKKIIQPPSPIKGNK